MKLPASVDQTLRTENAMLREKVERLRADIAERNRRDNALAFPVNPTPDCNSVAVMIAGTAVPVEYMPPERAPEAWDHAAQEDGYYPCMLFINGKWIDYDEAKTEFSNPKRIARAVYQVLAHEAEWA